MKNTNPASATNEAPTHVPPPLPDAVSSPDEPEKKRKKKYSAGSRDMQELGHAFSKGAFRMSNAVTVGLDTFHRRQSKSARRKRDGMVRDSMRNVARGFRDAAAEAGKAPYDICRRVNVWRQVRAGLRMVAPLFIPK